jgi:hypothetical protein
MRTAALIWVGAIAITGCAHSTELATSWRDPAATSARFHHVIALFVSRDAALRRSAEDRMASQIAGGVPAYTIVPDSEVRDASRVQQRVRDAGFDGAVVMRVVGVELQPNYAVGNSWYGGPTDLWGYWGTSWGYVYDPGYVMPDKIVTVESAVYSVPENKLIWAGRTETFNPSSLKKLIDGVVRVSVKRMRKEGLL